MKNSVKQSGRQTLSLSKGFTAVELLITLFIAAAFLMSGYQLYNLIIKDGGETRAQARASNVAYDYLQRYKSTATNSCTAQTPLTDSSITVTNLTDVTVTVAISCPYAATPSVSKVLVTLKYGSPQLTVSNGTYVTTGCPSGFIPVPGSATYGTSDFCVMKYEAKQVGATTVPISQATGLPWVNISQTTAIANSSNVAGCTGCHLITEAEWITIAQNVLNVASNWSGGSVGSGYIYSGHNDGIPANFLAADTSDANGYSGTGQSTPSNQRRTLILSNGEVIWDLAGNVWEWTSGTVTTGQPGVAGCGYCGWKEWPDVTTPGTLIPNVFPSGTGIAGASSWTSTNGIGKLLSNPAEIALRGIYRGGGVGVGVIAGVLTLDFNAVPSSIGVDIGFRVSR